VTFAARHAPSELKRQNARRMRVLSHYVNCEIQQLGGIAPRAIFAVLSKPHEQSLTIRLQKNWTAGKLFRFDEIKPEPLAFLFDGFLHANLVSNSLQTLQ
jgi:hypothetical protein